HRLAVSGQLAEPDDDSLVSGLAGLAQEALARFDDVAADRVASDARLDLRRRAQMIHLSCSAPSKLSTIPCSVAPSLCLSQGSMACSGCVWYSRNSGRQKKGRG